MYQILDGKDYLARKIREELRSYKVDKLKENGIVPKLAVILVGDDSAVRRGTVKNKSKACKDVGVEFEENFVRRKELLWKDYSK